MRLIVKLTPEQEEVVFGKLTKQEAEQAQKLLAELRNMEYENQLVFENMRRRVQ